MHPESRTLIFPAGMTEALAYRDAELNRGRHVVGASSLEHDPARAVFDQWDTLPFITDPGFDDALATVIQRRSIVSIYTPHFVVAEHLSRQLPSIDPRVTLVTGRGPADEAQAYQKLEHRVSRLPGFDLAPSRRPPLDATRRTGLIRLVGGIPGMCGEEKMAGIIEALTRAEPGDIVEIGSWWGRSAALLVLLARHFALGRVLCVDPWSSDAMEQGNALLDHTSAALDPEQAFRMFEINLSPLAGSRLNYLRLRAAHAARQYREGLEIHTEAFGRTRYTGIISVLHLDGNHAPDEVEQDVELWTPFVRPGGWIIFDDYEWAFGLGPKLAADRFVSREAHRIAATFRAGPALFVQLKGGVHD